MTRRVCAVLAVAAMLASACSGSESRSVADEKPDTIAHAGMWHYNFTSLEEMTATADLVVLGEVTAIERGRTLPSDDPESAITVRDVTIAITEALKGTASGATVVIEESGYDSNGSFELDEMPWSRIGDIGVFFLKHAAGQPAGHFVQIHPDGRILTHYRDDGQSRMYDGTVEMFSHSPLGDTLAELAPDSAAGHVRQAVVTATIEGTEPQRPLYEILSELEPDNSTSGTNTTGDTGITDGGDTGPVSPGGTGESPGGSEEVTE